MTRSALLPFQIGLIERLQATPTVMALVTGVFDHVPQGQTFPYVAYDQPSESPDRFFGQDGHALLVMLIIHTQDGSLDKNGVAVSGFEQGMGIMNAILDAVIDLDNPITVSGHYVVDVDVEYIHAVRDEDGISRRIELTLSASLEDV